MLRIVIAAGVIIVMSLLSGACDEDPVLTSACGDGVLDEGEQCDGEDLAGATCASEGFSGGEISCTATCELETFFCTQCGDGEAEGNEVCDGEDLAGESCESLGYLGGELSCAAGCASFDVGACSGSLCGDGIIQAPEVCDGSDLAGESCSGRGYVWGALTCAADCAAFDESGCMGQGTGETCDSPLLIESLPFTLDGTDITADYTDDATFFHPTCAIAEGVEVYLALQMTAGEEINFSELGGMFAHVRVMESCDHLSPCLVSESIWEGGDASFVAPETRTYFVVLEDRGGGGVDYDFSVSHVVCGDGLRRGRESCDGTELGGFQCESFGYVGGALGCDALCDFDFSACAAATCGDATAEGLEQCDDGNTSPGDGCDAACLLEMDQEVEPNDSPADALANNFWPGSAEIAALWSLPGDVDFYAVDVPPGGSVGVVTWDVSGAPSCAQTDTQVMLLDTDGTTELAFDDDGGVGYCSAIDPVVHPGAQGLAGGVYYVRVNDWSDWGDGPGDQAAPYRVVITVFEPDCGNGAVDLGEECDDGNTASGDGCDAACLMESVPELEPNDASGLAGGPFSSMTAIFPVAIGTLGDEDWFAVSVPGPASTIDATVVDGLDVCGPSGPIDSELQLLDADGVSSIAYNDDISASTNFCSALSVGGLPAGTYYLRTAPSAIWCSDCTYRYRLLINVR